MLLEEADWVNLLCRPLLASISFSVKLFFGGGSFARTAFIAFHKALLAFILRTAFWGCTVTAASSAFAKSMSGVEGSSMASAFIAFFKAMPGVEGSSVTSAFIAFLLKP